MRHLYISFLLAASQTLAAPATPNSGVLHQPLVPLASKNTGGNTLKRQAQANLTLYHFLVLRPAVSFGMPLEIGNPPQTVLVEPDPGSSLLWVPTVPAGKTPAEPASVYFDQVRSTTRRYLDQQQNLTYGANERVLVNVTVDDVSMSGHQLGEMPFGVCRRGESIYFVGRNVGVLGLRPPDQGADEPWDSENPLE